MAGSVSVFLPKEMRQLQWEVDDFKENNPGELDLMESLGIKEKAESRLQISDFTQYPYMFEKSTGISKYIYRTILGRGLRFGELGIANKMPRSATILANVSSSEQGRLLPRVLGSCRSHEPGVEGRQEGLGEGGEPIHRHDFPRHRPRSDREDGLQFHKRRGQVWRLSRRVRQDPQDDLLHQNRHC